MPERRTIAVDALRRLSLASRRLAGGENTAEQMDVLLGWRLLGDKKHCVKRGSRFIPQGERRGWGNISPIVQHRDN